MPYTTAGNYGLLWVAVGVVAGRPVKTAVTVWGTLAVNYGVKRLVARERPARPGLVRAPASPSFPSSHAARSAAAAVVLTEARPGLAPLWIAMAGAMAWTRLHAGVHHRSDVLAGLALGTVTGLAAVAVD